MKEDPGWNWLTQIHQEEVAVKQSSSNSQSYILSKKGVQATAYLHLIQSNRCEE